MTNEELKKKIMEVIDNSVDDWATRDKRGRIHVHIERIADALIAAGYRKQSDVVREFVAGVAVKLSNQKGVLYSKDIILAIINKVAVEFGADILYSRLADLEDKIESGELCDREEVRKETAKEIIKMLVGHKMCDKGAHMSWVIVKQDVLFIAEKYGVDLEEQQ